MLSKRQIIIRNKLEKDYDEKYTYILKHSNMEVFRVILSLLHLERELTKIEIKESIK